MALVMEHGDVVTEAQGDIRVLAQEMVEWAEQPNGWLALARKYASSSSKIQRQMQMWEAAVDYASTYAPEESQAWYLMVVQNTDGFVPYPDKWLTVFREMDLGPENA